MVKIHSFEWVNVFKDMITRKIVRVFIILLILSSNVGCDQISKNIVRARVDYNEEIGLIDTYVTLTKIENTGAFLSFGNTLPEPLKILLLNILPLTILCIGIFFLLTNRNLSKVTIIGICCVIGGGLGNIYDRIIYGSVTDFLHIDFVLFQTGIFNLADVSIMMGMFMVLVDLYFQPIKSKGNFPTLNK